MEVKDTAYVPQEVKRIDLKMYIKKYSDSIAIEVKDEESGKIIYFSVRIGEVKKMIEEGGFV